MSFKQIPDTDVPTATRILAAAEHLFSRQGVEGTSVREITRAADVNVASVNYYFGSKDDLATSVFETAIARVTRERLGSLEQHMKLAEERGEAPDLPGIVSIFIEPYLGDGNEDQGVLLARFILMHRLSPTDATRRIVEEYLNPVAQAFVGAFEKAAPGTGRSDMFWRYLLVVSATVMSSTEDRSADRLAALTEGGASVADRAAMRDVLVNFAVAGIRSQGDARYRLPEMATASQS